MIIPTLGLILWIAAGCLGLAYMLEVRHQLDRQAARIETLDEPTWADSDVAKRLETAETAVARANMAAKAAQKAIDEHLAWVAAQRTANEKAARAAPKPRRGRDR